MHFGVFTKFHIVLSTSAACVHAQSYPTLGDPMDCSPLSSSVHGISQARMLEWVAISSSRGSSPPRDRTRVCCVGRQVPTAEPPGRRTRKEKAKSSPPVTGKPLQMDFDHFWLSRTFPMAGFLRWEGHGSRRPPQSPHTMRVPLACSGWGSD